MFDSFFSKGTFSTLTYACLTLVIGRIVGKRGKERTYLFL